jgi:NitT/TauT family transport system ATP-binding protein
VSDIVFDRVSRVFRRDGRDFPTLDGVTFEVRDREFVAIVGPSGCGKTTCLRMVAGLESPTSGTVSVGARPVTGPGPDRAVVFQQFALFPWKTVHDNIDFGLRAKGIAEAARRERIARQVELMSLQGYESAYPHQLSGGMQQRVAIARSYVLDPDVLLMDEPFGALDAQTRTVMQEELIKLSRVNPRTVLFITHAVDEAVYLADRVVVMTRRPGRIREIIDVAPIRKAEHWNRFDRTEEVMDQESFVHLRTRIWRMLRGEQQPEDAAALTITDRGGAPS